MRSGAAVAVLCCASALGCGGHASTIRGRHGTPTVRNSPDEQPASPSADTLAFVEIARASGTLRTGSAAAALGRSRHIANLSAIAAAARTVLEVQPRDPGLIALRGSIHAALNAALAAPPDPRSQRAAAVAALSATDSVNAQLRRYASRHPEVQALIPD